MKLRVMTRNDVPEAVRLKDTAGWNQTSADWGRLLSACPDGCFVAEHDGRVVGTSATILYEDKFGWIGMLIVDAAYRGNGLGTALLEHAIQYLDSRGTSCMKLDATPQGKVLYEKFGFSSEYEIDRWMLERTRDKKRAGKILPDIENMLLLDKQVFGADRSALLLSLMRERPELTLVAQDARGETVGYILGRSGTRADQLGPWMADNQEVAAKLLDDFLARSESEYVFVDCLRANPWAAPLVKSHGFEASRSLTRMYRGVNRYPGQSERLCAILGPEFG